MVVSVSALANPSGFGTAGVCDRAKPGPACYLVIVSDFAAEVDERYVALPE